MTRAEVRHDDLMDPSNWPTDASPVTPGWRFVSIGFEGDPADIGGPDVWHLDWGDTLGWIVVAHPQYPHERHTMSVYSAGDPPVQFAAGEFSNGVWGVFVPEDGDGG